MTYDPRTGESTYLGMDTDDLDDFDGLDTIPEEDNEHTQATLHRSNAGDTLYRRGTAAQQSAVPVPPTEYRPSAASRYQDTAAASRVSQDTVAREPLYRKTSARQAPRAVPSPQQQSYAPAPSPASRAVESRLHRTLALFEAFVLFVIALALRLAAILFAALVVASVFLTGSARARLISALNLTSLLVPASLMGQFVVESPFGGVFRGDLAIVSIVLFIADYVCMRISASLRYGRERSV